MLAVQTLQFCLLCQFIFFRKSNFFLVSGYRGHQLFGCICANVQCLAFSAILSLTWTLCVKNVVNKYCDCFHITLSDGTILDLHFSMHLAFQLFSTRPLTLSEQVNNACIDLSFYNYKSSVGVVLWHFSVSVLEIGLFDYCYRRYFHPAHFFIFSIFKSDFIIFIFYS